jgi:hypothetical protein
MSLAFGAAGVCQPHVLGRVAASVPQGFDEDDEMAGMLPRKELVEGQS